MSFLLYLAQKGLVHEEDIPGLSVQAEKVPGGIDEVLAMGGMTNDQILSMKGAYYAMDARSLEGHKVETEVLKYIPEESARHYQFAPLDVVDHVLEVGIVDPDNSHARDAVQFI